MRVIGAAEAVMLRIRDIAITPALALAPMEGVTDVSFRRLVRRIGGVGLTVTEFIPARGLANAEARYRAMAEVDDDEHPVSIQVYGRDPDLLAEGARAAVAMGADIVDLNLGCPSKQVCASGGGSALMREPELVQRIVAAMRAAVEVPFTVKMRAGWDAELRNAPEIAWMCQEEGVEAVTVHWRTRADRYGGTRTWDKVAEVRARLSIPVIANGDIVDVATAREALSATGAHGLMVGRGAIQDPWVFRRIQAGLEGAPPPRVDVAERARVLLGYFDEIEERFRSARGALGRWKKIARYFCDGVPHGDVLRPLLLRANSVEAARSRAVAFFERAALAEGGLDVDFADLIALGEVGARRGAADAA